MRGSKFQIDILIVSRPPYDLLMFCSVATLASAATINMLLNSDSPRLVTIAQHRPLPVPPTTGNTNFLRVWNGVR